MPMTEVDITPSRASSQTVTVSVPIASQPKGCGERCQSHDEVRSLCGRHTDQGE